MLEQISWLQYISFVAVALVLYYAGVGLVYYRTELMQRLSGAGKGAAKEPAPAATNPAPRSSLVNSSSVFAASSAPTLADAPAESVSASQADPVAATAPARDEAPGEKPAQNEVAAPVVTSDTGAATVRPNLSPAQLAALASFQPGSANVDETKNEENETTKGNQTTATLVTPTDDINKSDPSDVGPAHDAPTLAAAEPVALGESSEPLEMLEMIELLPESLADEVEEPGLLIGADNLQEMLSQASAGTLTREQLHESAPELEDTLVIEQFFAASKSKRRQQINALFDEDE